MSITQAEPPPPRGRSGLPTWAPLLLVTLVAGAVRIPRLSAPSALVFDEHFYARDACYYALRTVRECALAGVPLEVHPPLGKWLIAAGIKVFGFGPFGGRIVSALAGVLTVAILYILAKKLLGSALAGAVAAGILALDFMHVIHSRMAMLDGFLTLFSVTALLFIVKEREWLSDRPASRFIISPWRLAAGVMIGAALATKWAAIFPVLGVLALAIAGDIGRREGSHRLDRTVRESGVASVLCFVVVPLIVYLVTHVGRFGLSEFWPQQLYMYDQLAKGYSPHEYSISAWRWFLARDAYPYYFDDQTGPVQAILAAGNPLLWVPGALALMWLTVRAIRDRVPAARTIAIAFLCGWLPWAALALGGVARTFLYYVLPSLPFLALGLAWAIQQLSQRVRPWAALAVGAVAVSSFAFMYPVLTAVPTSRSGWETRTTWFDTCPRPGTDPAVQAIIRNSRGCRSDP